MSHFGKHTEGDFKGPLGNLLFVMILAKMVVQWGRPSVFISPWNITHAYLGFVQKTATQNDWYCMMFPMNQLGALMLRQTHIDRCEGSTKLWGQQEFLRMQGRLSLDEFVWDPPSHKPSGSSLLTIHYFVSSESLSVSAFWVPSTIVR